MQWSHNLVMLCIGAREEAKDKLCLLDVCLAAAVPEDAVPSRLLHERLAQLEAEIARFRMENSTLARLRQERESAVAIVQ